ncbi:NAC domain-containing protein 8 [Melia azedarach]|uniref:NAC domain-containing protein 8 n=1 Tax=Melia azedarach TaxID=155640 RepID=A0ACC1X6B7_MELAZ|nr:NAC domain-containing protein 8 [Melia azedarach]
MAQRCGSNVISTESTGAFDQLDHLPLASRRKLLVASIRASTSCLDAGIKEEEEDKEGLLSIPSVCSVRGTDQQLALKQCPNSEAALAVTFKVSTGEILENSTAADHYLHNAPCRQDVGMPANTALDKVEVSVSTLYKNTLLSDDSTEVKVENSDNIALSTLGNGVNDSSGVDAPADKVNNDAPNDLVDDDLDHIVLKERQRMMLKRGCSELEKQVVEGTSTGFSEDLIDPCAGKTNAKTQSADFESPMTGSECNDMHERKASNLGRSSVNASSITITARSSLKASQYTEMPGKSPVPEASKSRKNMVKCSTVCSPERAVAEFNSCDRQCNLQPGCSSMHVSTMRTTVKVKVEPVENTELTHSEKNVSSKFSPKTQKVKSEMEIPNELYGDEVDHMLLQDRMKLRILGGNSESKISNNFVDFGKTVHQTLQHTPIFTKSAKQPRKRKKTATDSVETALEEDAPGLLKVLLEQGVSVGEIKLYGETESDDVLDETFNEDSFSELEAVMSKLFFQRNSLLKFASVRGTKDSKPSYCLACLFSLVEQARYLEFRKWPVEWGWCRDLQSFIFVFKRHNRIVLERPEYGYATYFFELLDSLPVEWQIKRLVTAMKLTNCGRVNLIENKSLSVGEDLTEGEAKVLMEFGWVPNTGLGTMLNYCDRVFHDRKNEKDMSEWRSKIGKLLVDGYNGGTIVSTNIPDSVIKYRRPDSPEIKLEL